MKVFSVSDLQGLTTCSEYLDNAARHLDKPSDTALKMSAVKKALLHSLFNKTEDEAVGEWDVFMNQQYDHLPSIDVSVTSDREDKEELNRQVIRFIKFFYDNSWHVVATSASYSFKDNIESEDEANEIKGMCDLIVSTPEGMQAFCIKTSSNLRPKARDRKNMPQYDIRILGMAAGLSEKYPLNRYGIITLKSPKDKNGFSDIFNEKDGDNIIAITAMGDIEIIENLHISLQLDRSSNDMCEKCYMKDVCSTQMGVLRNVTFVPKKKKEEKKLLTPTQSQVVNHTTGPMVVVAVPGAGKTHSLVERLKSLIDHKVKADSIVFVTFTRKAAAEISSRVSTLIKDGIMPNVFTFHSLAYQILKDHPDAMKGKTKLASSTDVLDLVFKAMNICPKIEGISYKYANGAYGIRKSLVSKHFDVIDKYGVEAWEERNPGVDVSGILKVYDTYKALYKEEGYYSYDELIPLAIGLLKDKNILKEYQDKWSYFMADEFQDASKEQAELLYLLSGKTKNLVVVGDDDQAIYKWRGGSSEFMLRFQNDFPSAKCIYMMENFRTTSPILSVANALIEKNPVRYEKSIVSTRGDGTTPIMHWGTNNSNVIKLVLQQKRDLSEIAILARTNAELEKLYKDFCACGVPVRKPRNFLIKEPLFLLLKELCAIATSGIVDDLVLYRALSILDVNIPVPQKDGETVLECINRSTSDYNNALVEITLSSKALKEEGAFEDRFAEVVKILNLSSYHPAVIGINQLIEEGMITSPSEFIQVAEGMLYWGDDREVEYPVEKGMLNLMTCHKAKGKEFPFVVISNMEDFKNNEEDRNLLYVSMTRAENILVMCVDDVSDRSNPELAQEIREGGGIDLYEYKDGIWQRAI